MQRVLMVFLCVGLGATTTWAQDPVKVAPKQCKVAFENEYVRVLRWTEAPHDKIAMHEHPALVSVSVSPGKTRFTAPDGKTTDTDAKAGQVTWSDATKHSSENLSNTTEVVVQVELKKKPSAALAAVSESDDSLVVDPTHYKVEFQNDQVCVVRVHYGPNEKSVMHSHPASVAVFLTDGQTKFTLPDGKTTTSNIKAGQAVWSDQQKHQPENTGGKAFELVLVELKQ
jgi:beta-alanine degradation protein BauB